MAGYGYDIRKHRDYVHEKLAQAKVSITIGEYGNVYICTDGLFYELSSKDHSHVAKVHKLIAKLKKHSNTFD